MIGSSDHTTNLTPCSTGHDWQAVEHAMTGWSVLVVCRRCAVSKWVGMTEEPGKITIMDGTRGMERGR